MFDFLTINNHIVIARKDLITLLVTEGLMDKEQDIKEVIDFKESELEDLVMVSEKAFTGKLSTLRKGFGLTGEKLTLRDISEAINKELAETDEPINNVVILIEDSNGSSSFAATKDMLSVFTRPGEGEIVALLSAFKEN